MLFTFGIPTVILLAYKGGENLTVEERAEYDKARRATVRQYVFRIDQQRGQELDAKLAKERLGKTEWFKRCVDEYLSKK